jgi:hypothetical protein
MAYKRLYKHFFRNEKCFNFPQRVLTTDSFLHFALRRPSLLGEETWISFLREAQKLLRFSFLRFAQKLLRRAKRKNYFGALRATTSKKYPRFFRLRRLSLLGNASCKERKKLTVRKKIWLSRT